MAGPMTRCQYISDDGNTYYVRTPVWASDLGQAVGGSLQTCGAVTTESPLPKGYRPRVRYVRLNDTGERVKVVVHDPASDLYTAEFGHGAIRPTLGDAVPLTDNATLEGRTGERDRHI